MNNYQPCDGFVIDRQIGVKGGADANIYMNIETGRVDSQDPWDYQNEKREEVNAVALREVVPAVWDSEEQC
ncbi:hypothetical protein [Sediminispirochaeta bajacaliforniensis]|uniref:hypothetical protein n=1 Tax=Sediminispirochaeta bajacaliforniensis TaxID=148 RepID=UPI000374306F|nr:hypothetical protein [Sediminispirochaeta bajacaliforniensis]